MLVSTGQKIGRRSQRGNLAVITGVIAIPLAMIIAMTVEMVALTNERARMQAAVDAAALAGARELAVSGGDARNANGFAETFALNQVADLSPRVAMTFTANQNADGGFEVSGVGVRGSFFGNMVPPGGFTIRVSAVGEALNQQPLCVLALPSLKSPGLGAGSNSSIQASNCLVHSNGNLETTANAKIMAGLIQATGSVTGSGFFPAANSGAIGVPDPFAVREIKLAKHCSSVPQKPMTVAGNGNASLIGGAGINIINRKITVTGNAVFTIGPGEYHFCQGLRILGNGTLKGDNVVMIFEGPETFQAGDNSRLSLSGRQTGNWAGFLLVTTRNNRSDVVISSKMADKLLGTIYLPGAKLIINASGTVAEASKWSVVVAQGLVLDKNAQLVINSDYTGSGVPVPVGVGNKAGNAKSGTRLRR